MRLDNHLNSLGSIQPLTRNLAPRLTNLLSQVPISSWVERSNAAWSALLRSTTSSRTGRVLNSGLDLDPNPESCTLPLDQLAESYQGHHFIVWRKHKKKTCFRARAAEQLPVMNELLHALEPGLDRGPQSLKATPPPAIVPSVLTTRPWPVRQNTDWH